MSVGEKLSARIVAASLSSKVSICFLTVHILNCHCLLRNIDIYDRLGIRYSPRHS